MRFSEVVSVLKAVHMISNDHSATFIGRLKALQSHGFPEGVNVGKGTVADYSIGQLIQVAVATELIQYGMTPQTIIKTLGTDWRAIYHHTKFAWDQNRLISSGKLNRSDRRWDFIVFFPESLDYITDQSLRVKRIMSFRESFMIVNKDDLGEFIWLETNSSNFRAGVINLTWLVVNVYSQILRQKIKNIDEIDDMISSMQL